MRIVALAVLGAAALTSAALAGPASTPDLADFAYSVTIRNLSHRTAICVARDGDPGQAFRLFGLGSYGGMDWAPDGSMLAVAMEKLNIGPIRIGHARRHRLSSGKLAAEERARPFAELVAQ